MYPELEGAPLMGRRRDFERESIESSARDGMDAMLVERAVHCLEYLAQLASTGLGFVFKGGTACQLLVGGELQRLSIDVDIATDVSDSELVHALDEVKARMGGRAYSHSPVERAEDERVPLRMYNITAPTHYPAQTRWTMVKLDVVMEEPGYDLAPVPLRTFYYASDLEVRAPTLSAMLGDKMSTLGPRTTGLRAHRAIDNLKQFYDIGSMLGMGFDVASAEEAYASCFHQVSRWRGLDITLEDAHADLEEWCKVASALPNPPKGRVPSERLAEVGLMAAGLEGFGGYIRRPNRLSKRRLREVASRTALLSSLMRTGIAEGPLVEYVREPMRFQGAVVAGLQTVLDGLSEVPREERWHIHVPEFKASPLALAAWWGRWDPNGLAELLA